MGKVTLRSAVYRWILVALLVCAPFAVFAEEERENHEFGADVGKMMHIIIHSLYQNPEIFMREVISNAADALTKFRVQSLSSGTVSEVPLEIKIAADKEARTITITDTGIAMTREELVGNLGNLGASGTKKFLEQIAAGASASKLIGQFGVGFYSVFLVGENVKVASKSDNSTDQWVWESQADGKFQVYKDPRGTILERGTEITIELKTDAESYTEPDTIKKIVQRYSEFIDFPIYVQACKTEKVPKKEEDDDEKPEEEKKEDADGEGKEEDDEEHGPEMEEVNTCEWQHVNEQKPIWMRQPTEVTEDEYHNFYEAITKDSTDPLYYSHFSAEGEVEFKSILYIPGKSPFNLFDPSAGLMTNIRLYVRRVFITDEFKDLLPRYLNFIRGVVDSDDLPLNVSREVLQENRLLKVIRKRLTRKALTMFKDIADKDDAEKEKAEEKKKEEDKSQCEADDEKCKAEEEKAKEEVYEPQYQKFWAEFGKSIRLGVIEDASNRARLTKLLRYKTSKSNSTFISLEDYVERMHESQKGIFYSTGENIEQIEALPFLERAMAEDVEVLYMDDPIDSYVVGHITEFGGHKLIDLAKAGQLRELTEKEKKIDTARRQAWEPFTKWAKDVLGNKVEKVTLSAKLTTTPCIVVSPEYGVTATMHKIMKAQALADGAGGGQEVRRILELNPRHAIVDELRRRWKANADDAMAKDHLELLFDVASLQSGFDLAEVNKFSRTLHKIVRHDLNIDDSVQLVEEEQYEIDWEEEEDTSEEEDADAAQDEEDTEEGKDEE